MRAVVLVVLLGCDRVLGLAQPGSPDAPGLTLVCPASYMHLQSGPIDGTFRFGPQVTSFTEAERACVDDTRGSTGPKYTHLAIVATPASQSALVNLLDNALPDPSQYYYVGLTARAGIASCPTTTPPFLWITDDTTAVPTTSPPWADGYPTAVCDPYPCGYLGASAGGIVNGPCNDQASYVCSCDDLPEDVTRF